MVAERNCGSWISPSLTVSLDNRPPFAPQGCCSATIEVGWHVQISKQSGNNFARCGERDHKVEIVGPTARRSKVVGRWRASRNGWHTVGPVRAVEGGYHTWAMPGEGGEPRWVQVGTLKRTDPKRVTRRYGARRPLNFLRLGRG